MFRRREAVPFAFVAEADRFRSNVTPPPRERATAATTPGAPYESGAVRGFGLLSVRGSLGRGKRGKTEDQ